ncbi:hypothetical protein RJ640_007999 [Escallonia rubra]|uniref:Magnesium transporter n=1 Tax=Escallonia rubra TaxID=112253 RepID=A0AA88QPN5_9ASTE|nr:hypothetical protein RJ640_007997 [Escallonia rubra]KAK2994742.1 hypothetical protein RJ640_007999 [Escallonia rubra]
MAESRAPFLRSVVPQSVFSHNYSRCNADGQGFNNVRGPGFPGLKKRGHAHTYRSWTKIDPSGNSKVLELDKATVMRHCSLPARDLRLLDPLFIYPSSILGREKAIVVSLEQIRCIITADEVILRNSLDGCVAQYTSELCKRLETNKDHSDDLPFEFRALELALEITCMSLDAQVKELELEIYPVLDELASSISTLNLERVRRFKGHLLALTQRVQKVCDEIEHLMDDDGDMAEMYLTEKKQRREAYTNSDFYDQTDTLGGARVVSKSAPTSPVGSISGTQKLQRDFSSISSSKHGSVVGSSIGRENIDQLEMLLEAYFVFSDNTLNNLLSLKEYIDDTEDLINITLGSVQNQLIKYELLLTAATFVVTIFAVVTGIFGMNFADSVFDDPSLFAWILMITGVSCVILYVTFLVYLRHKKIFPL